MELSLFVGTGGAAQGHVWEQPFFDGQQTSPNMQGCLPMHEQPELPPILTQVSLALHWFPPQVQMPVPVLHEALGTFEASLQESVLPQPQAPLTHANPGVPPMMVQSLPHAPQLVAELSRSVSQPSSLCVGCSQSAQPVSHTGTHLPCAHVGAAVVCCCEQAKSHAPQFAALLCRSVSQPSVAPPEQLSQP